MRTLAAAALLLLAAPVSAAPDDLTLAAATRAVDALITGLDTYSYPDVGTRIQALLRKERGRLIAIRDREALVTQVNALLAESHDLHLKIRINTITPDRTPVPNEAALLEKHIAHGLMGVRRLPGNIGYLKLRYFAQDADGAAMIDQAMALLRDTNALIIDLRENTGGGGTSDTRLLGHLSATPIPMARILWRQPDGSIKAEQRKADIPATGPLYADRPVFLLTARRTVSAAEGFAYDLQAAQRALLVGEPTRGGANPANRGVELGAGMSAFVPNGRVEHPTTHGNWEGKGVQPDIPTPPRQALVEAYSRALAAAKPLVATPKSEKERADAIADPEGTLRFDAGL
jgi:C-terminal processing protease CtpA/Prc